MRILTDHKQITVGCELEALTTHIRYKVLSITKDRTYVRVTQAGGSFGVGEERDLPIQGYRLKDWIVSIPFKEYYNKLL